MTRSAIRSRAALAGFLAGAAALTGCAHSTSSATAPSSAVSATYDEPVLNVSGAYMPQPPTADMAAAYFTLTNTGRLPGTLTNVTSDIATTVTMHRTVDNQMQQEKAFTIPAGGTLALRTGGNHLMLSGLKHRPTVGETVTLHLRFAGSDSISVRVPVKPATYQPPN